MGEVILKILFKTDNSNAWIRNSFHLGTAVPGISDLDITVNFYNAPSFHEVQSIRKKYAFLKLLFPFMGEMNILVESELKFALPFFNKYEAARDPHLNQYEYIDTDEMKAAFLLRMYEADLKNLSSIPKLREKKWKSHLESTSLSIIDISEPKRLLESILKLCDLNANESKIFLEKVMSSGSFEGVEETSELDFITFFPHRWSVWANVNGGVVHRLGKLNLTDERKSLIKALLYWELMGLYTQFRLMQEESNIIFYIGLLTNFLNELDFKNLALEFGSLNKIVKEWSECCE
jgi:hypothetical protein